MSEPSAPFDTTHYEQTCDQAIAMCNGNLRSTIKALIMANEYLEVELLELLAALEAGIVEKLPDASAAKPGKMPPDRSWLKQNRT
jgi:hypothetical protein